MIFAMFFTAFSSVQCSSQDSSSTVNCIHICLDSLLTQGDKAERNQLLDPRLELVFLDIFASNFLERYANISRFIALLSILCCLQPLLRFATNAHACSCFCFSSLHTCILCRTRCKIVTQFRNRLFRFFVVLNLSL